MTEMGRGTDKDEKGKKGGHTMTVGQVDVLEWGLGGRGGHWRWR